MTTGAARTHSWRWLGAFSVRIDAPQCRIYVDPFALKEKSPPADLVLLTNPRAGHASREDVALLLGPETVVAGPKEALERLRPLPARLRPVGPGDDFDLLGVGIRAVPAANRELSFFPRERDWVGYVLTVGGRTFYHAGATDALPELGEIRADVSFVPVSGRYLMGLEEAQSLAAHTEAECRVALFLAGDRFRPYEGFEV